MFVVTVIIAGFNYKSMLLTLPPYFSFIHDLIISKEFMNLVPRFACPKEGKA
jgi:hypothetical protein